MEKRSNKILENLDEKERKKFLKDLIEAADKSLQSGSLKILSDCYDKWEAIADLNAIPGLKEKVWNKFEHLKRIGRLH